jgi:hypothetical protein
MYIFLDCVAGDARTGLSCLMILAQRHLDAAFRWLSLNRATVFACKRNKLIWIDSPQTRCADQIAGCDLLVQSQLSSIAKLYCACDAQPRA